FDAHAGRHRIAILGLRISQLGKGAEPVPAHDPVAGLEGGHPCPTATTSPAPSLPGTNGGSGRNWYLPASISTSTYCTPRAAMRTCTSPGPGGEGSGSSRNASTSGPPKASQTIAFISPIPPRFGGSF